MTGVSGDTASIRYIYSENPIALMELIRHAAEASDKLPKRVKYITVATVNEEAEKLVNSLLPEAKEVGGFYVASMDLAV